MGDPVAEIRQWITATLGTGCPIRDAMYRCSLSAIAHRLIKFGPDPILNECSARDLLNLLLLTGGHTAEWLLRASFTRALIENDQVVVEYLAKSPFLAESRAWYWRLVEALIGRAQDPAEIQAWIDGMRGEELAVARLLIARVYPDCAQASWLDQIPQSLPRIAAELSEIVALKPQCKDYVRNWQKARPNLIYA